MNWCIGVYVGGRERRRLNWAMRAFVSATGPRCGPRAARASGSGADSRRMLINICASNMCPRHVGVGGGCRHTGYRRTNLWSPRRRSCAVCVCEVSYARSRTNNERPTATPQARRTQRIPIDNARYSGAHAYTFRYLCFTVDRCVPHDGAPLIIRRRMQRAKPKAPRPSSCRRGPRRAERGPSSCDGGRGCFSPCP